MKIKIQDKATIVVLNCAFSWGNVTDKEITDETTSAKGATRGSLRVRKTLLPDASGMYVNALCTILGKFYRYHTSKTYSTPIEGQRVMPVAFYMDYMQEYGRAKAQVNAAMDALVAGYPAAVVQAQALLGASFKAEDYPPAEDLRRFLKFDTPLFLPVPVGDNIMNALGAGVAADVDGYVGDMMQAAAKDAKTRLRKAVARMAESLGKKDGRIFDSMTDSIDELARELPALAGLADDPELHSMIKEVKDTLAGYTADVFRDDKGLRSTVGAQAMDILKRMGG